MCMLTVQMLGSNILMESTCINALLVLLSLIKLVLLFLALNTGQPHDIDQFDCNEMTSPVDIIHYSLICSAYNEIVHDFIHR